MGVLLYTHPRFLDHTTPRGHPERPARLDAVLAGIDAAGVGDAVQRVPPRAATRTELERVHEAEYLEAIQAFCESGGGHLDPDTSAVPASWEAAVLAAGAGLDAVDRLSRGEADAAFCAVRPPGHHATPNRAMGFCLINNVAVTAAALAARGERVVVLDWDVHHGNGTQDAFWQSGEVMYVSLHQWPLYPGTGRLLDTGAGAGTGLTLNFPLPPGATGDVELAALDEVVAPAVERFEPTWLLVSAGFDAHRQDPIAELDLSAADYADMTRRVLEYVPPGRIVVFLEGGYDLEALAASAGATVATLAGAEHRPEQPSSGGPGRDVVDAALRLHR